MDRHGGRPRRTCCQRRVAAAQRVSVSSARRDLWRAAAEPMPDSAPARAFRYLCKPAPLRRSGHAAHPRGAQDAATPPALRCTGSAVPTSPSPSTPVDTGPQSAEQFGEL